MDMWRRFPIILAVSFICACAQAPKEAVTLSDLVGKDLVAMRTAHTALVRQVQGHSGLASICQHLPAFRILIGETEE